MNTHNLVLDISSNQVTYNQTNNSISKITHKQIQPDTTLLYHCYLSLYVEEQEYELHPERTAQHHQLLQQQEHLVLSSYSGDKSNKIKHNNNIDTMQNTGSNDDKTDI